MEMEMDIIIKREQSYEREVFTEILNTFKIEAIYATRLMEVYHRDFIDRMEYSNFIFELLRVCKINDMIVTIEFNSPFTIITINT